MELTRICKNTIQALCLMVTYFDHSVLASPQAPDAAWQNSPFFNTRTLQSPLEMQKLLKEEGFTSVTLTAPDGISLDALFLERPHARCNMVLCAGWLPGRKEGMASFLPLIPPDCNVLIFDARAHGKSGGSFVTSLYSYGMHEYKDIIGALNFIKIKNNTPTFIVGTCAGAFNAAHALIHLKKSNNLEGYNIAGLVFDSGWADVTSTSHSVIQAQINESLALKTSTLIKCDKKNARNSLVFKIASASSGLLWRIVHTAVIWPAYYLQESSSSLYGKMKDLTVPVFFIHSTDDEYTPALNLEKLIAETPFKRCWWITTPSKHACHNLKYKKEYQTHLHTFIDTSLAAKS